MLSATFRTYLQRLFHLRRVGGHFETPRYLLKWLFISTLIGLVAGVGAIVFTLAIKLATQFFLGRLVGYLPPDPAGEGSMGVMSLWSAARPWLLPVITTTGGLLAGIIVFSLAPEAEGHGTDAAIAAFHQGKPIRARIPLVKLVASAITIGSGGSAGREGPSAQISAGFGSILGNLLHLDTQDRRIAIATGIGAGIGAIFRAPLGGAVLAAEILYKHDLEVEALIPALIASIIGYSVYGAYFGWNPIFAVPASLAFTSPAQLLYYVLIGLLCGLIGLLYARGFYGITDRFHQLPLPRWLKPAIGGLFVGLIGLVLPEALGMGYGWVQVSMSPALLSIPLWVVLLLPFAKIVTTGFSIGSGGSGGIFGPGMVIGAMVGAIVWRLMLPCAAGRSRYPGPIRDRRHDGALRGHRACATGSHADGGGDDGQPVHARARDACGRHLRHHRWGEDDLHQPGRHACRLACAPASILVPAALDAGSSSGNDSIRTAFHATTNASGGGGAARRTHHQWSTGPRRTWEPPGGADARRYRTRAGGFAEPAPGRGGDESGGAPRAT